jgi:hypothetical protein
MRGAALACMLAAGLSGAPASAADPAAAGDALTPSAGRPVALDIPAQPLAEALYAYSAATGVELLVDGGLLAGRRSTAIAGALMPQDALQALIAGSGLTAVYTAAEAFTLIGRPEPRPATSPGPDYAAYTARLQTAVTQALCRDAVTRPGYYRVAVQMWIAASGRVARAGLLGTTGSAQRDAALTALLTRLTVGEPPRGAPQPVTLLILPRAAQPVAACDPGETVARQAVVLSPRSLDRGPQ